MARVVSIFKNKVPVYFAYQRSGPMSQGARLMITCMGFHWFPALKCWTNASDNWMVEQVQVLLSQQPPRKH